MGLLDTERKMQARAPGMWPTYAQSASPTTGKMQELLPLQVAAACALDLWPTYAQSAFLPAGNPWMQELLLLLEGDQAEGELVHC